MTVVERVIYDFVRSRFLMWLKPRIQCRVSKDLKPLAKSQRQIRNDKSRMRGLFENDNSERSLPAVEMTGRGF